MRSKLPMTALILSAIFWGIAIPVFKLAPHIPLFSYALIRFIIATVIVLPIYLQKSHYQPVKIADLPSMFWVGFAGITLNIGFLYLGLVRTTAIDAAIIIDLIPIVTIFAAAIFLHESLTKHHVLGSAVAFIGALIIIIQPLLQSHFGPDGSVVGNLFVVISVLANVWFNILSKELFAKYTALTVTTYIFIVGIVTFLPFAVWEYFSNPHWITTVTGVDIFSVTYYAIFGSVLAYFFFEWGLSHTDIANATITDYIIPVVTIAISVVFLHETISPPFIVGTVLTAIGVFYCVHIPKLVAKRQAAPQLQTTEI